MMEERIGVAGCGRMGLPMAQSLHRGGHDVVGFDIRPASEFETFAQHMIFDPHVFSQKCTTVFSVVRDKQQTEELLFERQAILRGQHTVRTLVICSTLSPRYLEELRGRISPDVSLIDAPMSGAAIAAQEARLSFMLGGDTEVLDRLQPFFDTMGTRFHRMGAFGAGMTGKVLNNFSAAASVIATRQVLAWADQLNVDRGRLLALMNDSSGQTWFGSNFGQIEFAQDGFSTNNTIGILKKDVESVLDAVGATPDQSLPAALIDALAKLKPDMSG
ncbi:MAG: NAD(P)-binding domain-containing protein [Stappiaceae bacterium]